MKKMLIAGLLMLGISTMSFAQGGDTTNHHKHDKKVAKELNLTQDQKDKLKAYDKDAKAQKDKIKNDPNLTADQKKEQLKTLKAEHKKQFSSVLTPEQKEKMKDMKGKHKKHSPDKTSASPNSADAKKS